MNSRNTHDDASASWYTPQSGVNVHQLILDEATMDPKDMIWAALEGEAATKVDGSIVYLLDRARQEKQ